MHALLNIAADTLFPPRCLITGERVAEHGNIAPTLWRDLSFLRKPLCHCCGLPFPTGVEVSDKQLCLGCLSKLPKFDAARCALAYDDASRRILLKFKHGDGLQLRHVLARWMQAAGREMLSQADMLVPVPLHRWRLLKRKYNQAQQLTRALSKLSGVREAPRLLTRQRATISQGGLDRKARRRNVRRAFHVRDHSDVSGKHIVLVDDVYTTGATVNECARVLKAAGASTVNVLCAARVLRPSQVA